MRIPLSGEWLMKDFVGEDWLWRDAHMPETRDVRWWRKGSVPGSVQDDLWRNGEIANPYVERNTLAAEWASDRTWLYKRTFAVDASLAGQRAVLRFEGVDYAARFYLNGQFLGSHRSMFRPAEFEVGGLLRYGSPNLLAVVLDPAPPEQPQVGYSERVRTLKTRMNYWWDFCPRLVHLGIWREVSLEFSGPVRVEDIFVRPQLPAHGRRAGLTLDAALSAPAATGVDLRWVVRFKGAVVAERTERHELAAGVTQLSADFGVDDPHLWWPNGAGEQPLYEAAVTVTPSSGAGAHDRAVAFGIRSLELVPNDAPDSTARPYTFAINGRPLYIRGWNWVPMDLLYGVPRPEKLERLLTLVRRAGVNLVRVWGGGLIESHEFYELCDRYGIMVWQEFVQSSSGIDNRPPSEPAFVRELVHEAEGVIPLRRNHPSLAVWCGGNELQAAPGRPCDGSEPLLAALAQTVTRLDPDRPWLPTSPSGPVFENSLENIERDPEGLHDVHGPWHHQGLARHFELYNAGTSLFHSEFGAEGATNLKTIEACVSEPARWPPTRDNAVWWHTGSWWLREQFLEEVLGRHPDDLAAFVRVTQYLQASGLQYALEADRRRWPRNSGTLPWQFNEPFPNLFGTPAVDYFAEPKPAYYAAARAYRPATVTASFSRQALGEGDALDAVVWLDDGDGAQEDVQLRVRALLLDHTPLEVLTHPSDPGAGRGRTGLAVRVPLARAHGIILLDLAAVTPGEATIATNRYLFCTGPDLGPLLALPRTTLAGEVDKRGDRWTVTLRTAGGHAALGVWLEDARPRAWDRPGWPYFDDNYFHLLPGEGADVRVEWAGVPEDDRRLQISAINADAVELT